MAGKIYGYMRVSTKDQCEDRQRIALLGFGVPEERLFMDKQSGKDFLRPGYQDLMQQMERGDTLVVKSLDRLGRQYGEIMAEWRHLTQDRYIDIVVLDMPLLNTCVGDDVTRRLIADLVLQIFSFVAQMERDMNLARQSEGIAAARDRGQRLGRLPAPRPVDYEEVRSMWESGEISATGAARLLGVPRSTFRYWVKK